MKKLLCMVFSLLVMTSFSQQIVQAEYFFDADPGYGNAQAIDLTSASEIEIDEMIDVSTLAPGFHSIHFRIKDENNQWSAVFSKGFFIENNRGDLKLIDYVEYFYDTDPGYGNAIPYTDFTPSTHYEDIFFSDVTGLSEGTHALFIRLRDELGQWSQTYNQEFELLNCDLEISGQVSHQDQSAVTDAEIILFQYFGEGAAIAVDTIPLNDGSYNFLNVCPMSEYFLKVIPESTNNFPPCYYGNTMYWQQATTILTEQSSISGANIVVFDFSNMDAGNSSVSGHIFYADSKGQPVKNIDVVLEYDNPDDKIGYEAVAYDRSNDFGEWNVGNLPNGSFRIKVEIPGLDMDTTYYVNITTDATLVENLDFYVDMNTGIYIDHFGIEEIQIDEMIELFPNPALHSNIWIRSNHSNLIIEEVTIYNYSGQKTGNQLVNEHQYLVNSQSWSGGFYILKIQTNKGVVIKKIIIE